MKFKIFIFSLLFSALSLGQVFAAGYSCPAYMKYTSCNAGYYMTKGGSYNATPQAGNTCTACPSGYNCAGGTANAVPACTSDCSYGATRTVSCGGISNGTYNGTQTCNATKGGVSGCYTWGGTTGCSVSCNSGYHNEGGACVSNTKTCSGNLSGASYGNMTWNGSAWVTTGCFKDCAEGHIAYGYSYYTGSAWGTCKPVSTTNGCHWGTYNNNGQSCISCPAGKWCWNYQETCPAGYFCPGGTYDPTYSGFGDTYKCKAGYYCPAGSSGQTACNGATYAANLGQSSCTACPSGYTANTNAGKTAASQCQISVGAGQYMATAGSGGSLACAAGTYKGAHNVNYGSTSSCAACAAVREYSSAGASSCSVCPNGQWHNSGHTGCISDVPENGIYYPGDSYPVCKPGYRPTNVDGDHWVSAGYGESCTLCPAGTYCPKYPINQIACPAGTYSGAGAGACTACSGATQYQDATAQSSCKNVSSGYYKSSNSAQTQCPASYRNGAGAADQNSCIGSFAKTGSQLAPATPGNCASVTATGTCTPGTCTYQQNYAGTITSNCTPTNCTKPITGVTANANYYANASSCSACPSGYPASDAGNSGGITKCYSGTKSRAWSGGQTACAKPANCATVSCNTCSIGACNYVAYANSAGTGDGAIKSGCGSNSASCQQTIKSVTANAGAYTSGTSCTMCPDGYRSGGGTTAITGCITSVGAGKYLATVNTTTTGTCAAGTSKAAHTVNYGSTSSCAACTGVTYSGAGAGSCTSCPDTGDNNGVLGYYTHNGIHDTVYGCNKTERPYTATYGSGACMYWYTSGANGSAIYNGNSIYVRDWCVLKSCIAGYWSPNPIPRGDYDCTAVGAGYWSASGVLSRNECPAGLTTIGFGTGADEVADCGRILNIGSDKLYLRSAKKTTPSLNVGINGTTYYGNMDTSTKGKLRINSGGTQYSVFDDSM